jgi:hypothetical protein
MLDLDLGFESFYSGVKVFTEEYWRTLIVFVFATALMLWQHSMGWNWDFNVYSMNGEYLFHVGNYIEWQRPILVPTIMGLLQFVLSRAVSEYVFVFLSSSFFYWASYRSAKSLDIDFEAFYILLMSPMAIFIGNFHGSEMLSLAFVMLFFSEIYRNRSGLWMSLAFLTRNTNFVLIPFGLVDRNWKRTVKRFSIAAVPVMIWLGFNWAALGDPFSAIANRIAINFYENPHNFPVKPLAFLKVPALSLLFIGAYLIKKRPELSAKGLEKVDWMLMVYSGYIILKYLAVDLRQTRFLYPLVFTSAYFAVRSYSKLQLSRNILTAVLAFNLVFAGFLVADTPVSQSGGFERAADYIDGCRAESDVWPQLAYSGAPATKPLEPELTAYRIRNGWRAVFFNPDEYFGNSSLQQDLPKLEQNPSYVVYGTDRCIESHVVNSTYLEKKRELDELRGETGVYEPTPYLAKHLLGLKPSQVPSLWDW